MGILHQTWWFIQRGLSKFRLQNKQRLFFQNPFKWFIHPPFLKHKVLAFLTSWQYAEPQLHFPSTEKLALKYNKSSFYLHYFKLGILSIRTMQGIKKLNIVKNNQKGAEKSWLWNKFLHFYSNASMPLSSFPPIDTFMYVFISNFHDVKFKPAATPCETQSDSDAINFVCKCVKVK